MDVRSFAPLDHLLKGLVVDDTALESAQCRAITQRLVELEAASVVVEHDYVDGNYLSEYASYYVRCHEPLSRLTRRVHVFKVDPSELIRLFEAVFTRTEDLVSEARLRQAYLGFVVIKPLPRTIFGKTCLAPPQRSMESSAQSPPQSPPQKGGDAKAQETLHFPVLRDYPVLLWGVSLTVRSLAFQEQDSEVAACSTAAIWSALHALERKITRESIPSTFDITAGASLTYIKRSLGEVARRFPTSGLGLEQMEAYLRSLGLDCIVCGATLHKGAVQLAEYLMAYASAGFPMLLVGNLYVSSRRGAFQKLGLHAMTALGYETKGPYPWGHAALRISQVFAHDDNVGPFSSYRIIGCEPGDFLALLDGDGKRSPISGLAETKSVDLAVEARIRGYLLLQHEGTKGGQVTRLFTPEYFIVPMDPKVRLPYEIVALFAEQIGCYFKAKSFQRYAPGASIPEPCWSITLLNVKDLKARLRFCTRVDRNSVTEILLKPFPEHVWVISFSTSRSEESGVPLLDFYVDATALRQSGGIHSFLSYDVPEADTFFAVIAACLLTFDPREASGMDPDLTAMLNSAARLIRAEERRCSVLLAGGPSGKSRAA